MLLLKSNVDFFDISELKNTHGHSYADSTKMISMCVCDDGSFLKDGECVDSIACGCVLENGMTVSEGYNYNIDCKQSCTCTDGEMVCVDEDDLCRDECTEKTHNCDENAECEDQRNGFKSACKIGCPKLCFFMDTRALLLYY